VPLDRARLTSGATRRCNPADWLADQGTGQGIPGRDQPARSATVDATDTAEEMTRDYLSRLMPAVRHARSVRFAGQMIHKGKEKEKAPGEGEVTPASRCRT
jgi:hypothetical protein